MKTVKKKMMKDGGNVPKGGEPTKKTNRGDRMVSRGEKKLEKVESKRVDNIRKKDSDAQKKLTKAEKIGGDNPTYRQAKRKEKKVASATIAAKRANEPIRRFYEGSPGYNPGERMYDDRARGIGPEKQMKKAQRTVTSEDSKRAKAQEKIKKGEFTSNRINKKKESKASSNTVKKGGTAKPKAAYGMAVKPSMMKKGGTTKKKK
jgi:hypothetical protein